MQAVLSPSESKAPDGLRSMPGGDLPRGRVDLGPIGCPVIVVGKQMIDWKTGKVVHNLPWFMPPPNGSWISPSGRYVAWRHENGFAIFDASTQKTRTVTSYGGEGRELHGYAGDNRLILGRSGQMGLTIVSLDGSEPNKVLRFKGTTQTTRLICCAASPDGKELACLTSDPPGVTLFDLTTGEVAGSRSAKEHQSDGLVAYSPEGDELTLVQRDDHVFNFTTWNRRGEEVLDFRLYAHGFKPTAFHDHQFLRCLAGKRGWWCLGLVVDRRRQQPVVWFRPSEHGDIKDAVTMLDADHALVNVHSLRSRSSSDLFTAQICQIPWDRIDASYAALDKREPAIIAAYEPMALRWASPGPPTEHGEKALAVMRSMLEARGRIDDQAPAAIEISSAIRKGWGDDTEMEYLTFDVVAGTQKLEPYRRIDKVYPQRPDEIVQLPGATPGTTRTYRMSSRGYSPSGILPLPLFVPKSPDLVPLPIMVQ